VSRDESQLDPREAAEILAALARLSAADRALAEKQRICPVADFPLGAMGVPKKVDVNGTPVFICCDGCRESLLSKPEKYLAKLAGEAIRDEDPAKDPQTGLPELVWPPIGMPESDLKKLGVPQGDPVELHVGGEDRKPAQVLSQLPRRDRALAEKQENCPVTDMPLGSMGAPIKVDVNGRPVFICCEGCRPSLLKQPAKYLAKLPQETVK